MLTSWAFGVSGRISAISVEPADDVGAVFLPRECPFKGSGRLAAFADASGGHLSSGYATHGFAQIDQSGERGHHCNRIMRRFTRS